MPHRHNDEYVHRHDFGADSHVHRLVEVVEHAHGAHGEDPHGHTHIIMTDRSERANGAAAADHRHRLKEPFEHEHPSESRRHRHRLGDLEHQVADRHWHPIEITEIELVIEPDRPERPKKR